MQGLRSAPMIPKDPYLLRKESALEIGRQQGTPGWMHLLFADGEGPGKEAPIIGRGGSRYVCFLCGLRPHMNTSRPRHSPHDEVPRKAGRNPSSQRFHTSY